MTRKETSEAILVMLANNVDAIMRIQGFSRPSRSIQYSRRIGKIKQVIELCWRRSVHQDETATAHIAPRMYITSQFVASFAYALNDDATLLGKAAEILMNESIGHLGPEKSLVVWRPVAADEFTLVGQEIADYLQNWVVPFADQYVGLRELLQGFEDGDRRLPRGDQWILRIAAVYLALGEEEKARSLLRSRFWEKPGLRERYRKALSFLDVTE